MSRGGYFRPRAKAWRTAHFEAEWSTENPAPEWWAEIDYAWQLDDGDEAMSAREFASFLGWKSKTKAADLMADVRSQQSEYGGRASGDGQTADKRRTNRGQRADTSRTKRGQSTTVEPADSTETADTARTTDGQKADTSCAGRARAIAFPPSTSTSTDPDLDRGAPGLAADAPPPAQAPDPPVQEPVHTERAPRKPGGATPDELVVYGVYRGLHPRKPPTPTPDDTRSIRRLLVEAGTVERAGLLLAWVHQSDDEYARQLRGEEPWPGGQRKARVDLESLSRHVGARLQDAERWEARGRATGVEPHATGPPARAGPRARPSIDELLAAPSPPRPDVIDVA